MALAAFLFHLVLSFVHVHPWMMSTHALTIAEASDGSPGSDAPLEPVADGYCAICANIAAFASVSLPDPAGIVRVAARLIACAFFSLSLWPERPRAYRLFQTRAPPSTGRFRPF